MNDGEKGMEKDMKILAWILVLLSILNVIVEPFLFGMARKVYSAKTWWTAWAGLALVLPLCGRILGWW
jgi:hypothetical protein